MAKKEDSRDLTHAEFREYMAKQDNRSQMTAEDLRTISDYSARIIKETEARLKGNAKGYGMTQNKEEKYAPIVGKETRFVDVEMNVQEEAAEVEEVSTWNKVKTEPIEAASLQQLIGNIFNKLEVCKSTEEKEKMFKSMIDNGVPKDSIKKLILIIGKEQKNLMPERDFVRS